MAKHLQDDFAAKHLYLEPPYRAEMTLETMSELNALVDLPVVTEKTKTYRDQFMKDGFYKMDADSISTLIVPVQKMQVAPSPSLFFACGFDNKHITLDQLDAFAPNIHDAASFSYNMIKEINRLSAILGKEPTLSWDFQAFIDTKGNLFHIDLDGHFDENKKLNYLTQKKLCLGFLRRVHSKSFRKAMSVGIKMAGVKSQD